MHEMAIAEALLRQLEEIAAANDVRQIDSVVVAAGVNRGVVPEALDAAFEAAAEGTVAEGAQVELTIVPLKAKCRACAHEFEPEVDSFLCAQCGVADVEFLTGDDIILKSISCRQEGAEGNEED
ncbi:MAG: hydrogenase maturation nickel metallochaperone HypA [bacterium]|nr:hydrogenase maturation nickel metallochaperone HypA [bacterium]